jgi:DNA-binding NarL/FixJ family response regulator
VTAPGARPRVLIADDHEDVLKAVSRLLAFDCDIVALLADGREVMEAVARLQPDVVLLDVNLRNVDGLTLCRELLRQQTGTKVIMFTAVDDPEIRSQSYEAGASAFVHKMVSEDLLAAIERVWAEQATQRAQS